MDRQLEAHDATIRRLRRQLAQRRQSQSRWAVAQHLAMLVDDGCETALLFLRRRSRPGEGRSDDVRRLREWRRTISEASWWASLERPMPRHTAAAFESAELFLAECGLHEWVRGQNLRKGTAPMTGLLLRHVAECTEGRVRHELPPRTAHTKKAAYQWLRRWRRRWRVSLGHIPVRDELSVDLRCRKAPSEVTKIPSTIQRLSQKGVHNTAPFSGPRDMQRDPRESKKRPHFCTVSPQNTGGDGHVALEPDAPQDGFRGETEARHQHGRDVRATTAGQHRGMLGC